MITPGMAESKGGSPAPRAPMRAPKAGGGAARIKDRIRSMLEEQRLRVMELKMAGGVGMVMKSH
jgi:hypothetical protein